VVEEVHEEVAAAAAADMAAVGHPTVVAEVEDLAAEAMVHHAEAVTAVDTVREEDRDTALTKSAIPDMPRRTRPRSLDILT
jgi:hypothetical protein